MFFYPIWLFFCFGGGSEGGWETTCLCSFPALAAQKWKVPKLIFFLIFRPSKILPISHVKHVLDPLCMCFTLFGCLGGGLPPGAGVQPAWALGPGKDPPRRGTHARGRTLRFEICMKNIWKKESRPLEPPQGGGGGGKGAPSPPHPQVTSIAFGKAPRRGEHNYEVNLGFSEGPWHELHRPSSHYLGPHGCSSTRIVTK